MPATAPCWPALELKAITALEDKSDLCPRVGHSGCYSWSGNLLGHINPVSLLLRVWPGSEVSLRFHALSSYSCRALQAAGDPGRYQNSDWASAFTSQLREYDYWATKVEGTIPDTLRGTLFRNGPGRSVPTIDYMHRVPVCPTTDVEPCAKQQKHKVKMIVSVAGSCFMSDIARIFYLHGSTP